MTHKSYETFCAYLDILSATLSYAKSSRALKHNERLIYKWINDSKRAKEQKIQNEFHFEYHGEEKYLHQHIKDCVSASVEEIEAAARSRARDGHWTVAMFQGQTVYKRDPKLIGVGSDILEMIGYKDDLLRDQNGSLVPEMVWHPPSTDLVQMILQAHTQKYKRQSSANVTLDINNRLSGGVMVASEFGPQKSIAAPLPALEIVEPRGEAVAVLRYEDAKAGDVAEAQDVDDAEAEAEDEPQAMTEAPEPVLPPPMPAASVNLSPLQRDLLARMRAPAGDAARTAPIPKLNPDRDSDDYNPDRTGAGVAPGGAVKVV
jgi:hypothetical protein